MDGTVLVADDDRTIRTVLTQALTRAGCRVHATSSLTQLLRWVEEGRGDVVISDVRMPDGDGLEMLPHISSLRPDLPVIVISAQNTIMTAIKAAEVSAFDYLPKPFDLPDLMKRTARALNSRAPRLRGDGEAEGGGGADSAAGSTPARAEPPAQDLPMIGRDGAMQELYRVVAQVMNTRLPVMITGESGTGKSLVARSLHGLSDRAEAPFVTVSAADLADPEAPARLLAQARGGSIVFEAIEDFDAPAQARLAQLIDREGEDCARLMATSQAAPAQSLADGRLRQDFFYRLDGAGITVPPLRARIEDIALLAEHFLAQAAAAGAPAREIDAEALALLRRHNWPGNVRQLENTLRSLAVTARAPVISRAEVEQALGTQPGATADGLPEDRQRLSDSVAQHLQRYFDLHGDMLPPVGLYERILHEIELPLIEIALDATGGNQARCADLLGINRNTLRKKMTQLGIRVTRRRKLM